MGTPPKFSIIIPVYNAVGQIKETIESILNQSNVDFEVLLVDDGSTDDSLVLIKEYADRNANFKVFTQENTGPGAARNIGIENAKGDYIVFVDSDDLLAEEALQKLTNYINKNPSHEVLLYTYAEENLLTESLTTHHTQERFSKGLGIRPTVDSGEYSGKEMFRRFLNGDFAPAPWNKVFKRSLFNDSKLRFEPTVYHQDFGLTPRLIGSAKKVLVIKDDLYIYRRRENSITYSCTDKHVYSIFVVLGEIWDFIILKGWEVEFRKVFELLFWGQLVHNYRLRGNQFTIQMHEVFIDYLQKYVNKIGWVNQRTTTSIAYTKSYELLNLLIANPIALNYLKNENYILPIWKTKSTNLNVELESVQRELRKIKNNKRRNILDRLKEKYWNIKNKRVFKSPTIASWPKITRPKHYSWTSNRVMDKLIKKRKTVLIVTVILSIFIGLMTIPTNNLVWLVASVILVFQGLLLFVSLCQWNDQKDTAVLIDKMHKKNIIEISPIVSQEIDFSSFEKSIIDHLEKKLEEVALDNRRQLYLLKKEK